MSGSVSTSGNAFVSTSTSVPQPSFGDTGFVAPAESAILAGRLADINAAFGGNLNTKTLSTPQGQLASSEAAILGDVNSLFLALANGVDPAYASGRMQDAIGRIYFIDRIPASATVVEITCSGAPGTVIPAGALLQASDGKQYALLAANTIPASGTVSVSFACTQTGPVACPAQTFIIFRTIPGWDLATSSAAGTPGTNVESRAAFEARRSASVALNSVGSVQSIRGAVLDVAGVLDAYVVDNPLGTPATIGGVALAPHSVYVAAVGGDPQAVARAIWSKKSLGCDYNGNTTLTVTDDSGYAAPAPSYPVTFQVPVQTAVQVLVTIAAGPGVPSNALLLVQAAILKAFSGGDGGARARIGGTIYASRFYAPVAALGAWAQILSIQIGTTAPTGFSVALPIDQAPVLAAANISLALV